MSAAARVVVIVLNWNGCRFLERCLNALQKQTYRDTEVVLVDNGSTDGSVAFVRERFPQVRLLVNETNLGFAAGNNQAIRATNSEFVALLNNDTEVAPDWLAELVRAAEPDTRVGACASRMLLAHRPEMIESDGVALDRAGIAWDWHGGEPDDPAEVDAVEVFGACAGAALYRRAMLDEIGLLDEDFFAYLEDVDLAWRAQWAGWRALAVPTARVLHFHSGTAGEGSSFKNRLLGRNKVWMIAQNYPWPHALWYALPILFYDLGALPYVLVWRGNWGPLHGRLEGLAGLGHALHKRQALRARRQVPPREVFARLAPLATPGAIYRRYLHLRGS